MILSALLPLLYHNAAANEVAVTKCEDYTCEEITVSIPKAKASGRVRSTKRCPKDNGVDWFSKIVGDIHGGSLIDYCVSQGYDTVANVKAYMPGVYDAMSDKKANSEATVLCNVAFDTNPLIDWGEKSGASNGPVTFQCFNYSEERMNCCSNWHPSCYNHRGAQSNWQSCGLEACKSECEDMSSAECSECCILEMAEIWNCYVPIVDCSEYKCIANGMTYNSGYPKFEKLKGKCVNRSNVFSKGTGQIEEVSLKKHCQANGFDGVGKVWTSIPDDTLANRVALEPAELNICNKAWVYTMMTDDFREEAYWPFTWECENFSTLPNKCCDHWHGDCYSRRISSNNYHACYTFGEVGSLACDAECGGGDATGKRGDTESSAACRDCCRLHQTQWNCPKATMTRDIAHKLCKKATNKNSCMEALSSDVGKCKFRQKKKTCYLQQFFENCDTLKGRACKAAFRGGMCTSDDKGRTCRELE